MDLGLSFSGLLVVALCVVDGLIAVSAFKKSGKVGLYLGLASVWACFTTAVYGLQLLVSSAFFNLMVSRLYSVGMIVMLFCMLMFVRHHTEIHLSRRSSVVCGFVFALVCLDSALLLLSPLMSESVFLSFYYVHSGFAHLLIACVVAMLLYKIYETPKEYKFMYMYSCLSILFILFVNTVFLNVSAFQNFDYANVSVVLYSICACVFYWSCFIYASHGMLYHFKNSIFENVDQGIVLFDRTDRIILHNELAHKFLPVTSLDPKESLQQFLKDCGIPPLDENISGGYSFQCMIHHDGVSTPLRCDYRLITNKKMKVIGKLFIFTNTVLETDILTGFHNLDAFEVFVKESNTYFDDEIVSVSVCDINGLSLVNASKGRLAGDALLKELADTLRNFFPSDSYFVRGRDATLIVVSYSLTEGETKNLWNKVKAAVSTDVVYAISLGRRNVNGVLGAVDNACRALRQKKLLDQKSLHSSALSSLIRALQECDNDTEAHVKRTQLMGAELGKRLGFTDVQLSDLSLLCLLHDIGKIAIPLEILNKPGKLNGDEWLVMRTHPEKGYQIANSSPELRGIAELIRHHHERWDGKGYPDGLSRESIPLLSRVISVVDAYDAMVSNRAYRKAMARDAALAELVRCAGAQFDPMIVSEFVHMLEVNKYLGVSQSGITSRDGLPVIENELTNSPQHTKEECVHPVNFMNYMLDAASLKILTVNKAFEEISGYTQADVDRLDLNQADLIPEEDRTEYLCMVSEYLAKNPIAYFEHRFVRKNGNIIYVLCMGRLHFDAATKCSKIEVIVIDSSNTYVVQQVMEKQRHKADKQLRYWEDTYRKDSLTGLLCRSAFQNDVEQKLLENKEKVMLLMLDVDKFKEYNDTYGHHMGDEFLILVAQTLEGALREEDLSCRMGGDEFAAALFFKKECSDEFMFKRAQQIFDKINMSLNSNTRGTTLSMGAVIADQEKNSFNKIYEASDRALYKSKENGRGRLSLN